MGRSLILTLRLESIHHKVQRTLEVREVLEDKTSMPLREAHEEGKRSVGEKERVKEAGTWRKRETQHV